MQARLTERFLADFELPEGKSQARIWDTQLVGFGVIVGKRTMTFLARGRVGGRQRFVTIGAMGKLRKDGDAWNVARARRRAKELIGEMASGATELAARGPDRHTLRSGLALHVRNLERRGKSPRTIKTISAELPKHMAEWMDRPITDITGDVLEDVFERIQDNAVERLDAVNPKGLALAIRVVSHVSVVWNALDRKHDLPGKNPAKRVERGELKARDSRIPTDGFGEWLAAVNTISPVRRDLQLLTLFSAMRASSVLPLKWSEVELGKRMIHAWAKGDKPYSVPLSTPAVAVLERRRRENEEQFEKFGGDAGWVFPTLSNARPVSVIHVSEPKEWSKKGAAPVRLLPGLHPLRRTHNSVAMELGIMQEHRERLLNHNGQGVNVRVYGVPQSWAFLEECQERVASEILRLMGASKV